MKDEVKSQKGFNIHNEDGHKVIILTHIFIYISTNVETCSNLSHIHIRTYIPS